MEDMTYQKGTIIRDMRFSEYQYLDEESANEKNKIQKDSKFWNIGKWENYVAPYLPEDCSGLTYVDMGCNAGLFLKLAEDRGFSRVVGVEKNPEAVERGLKWRDKVGGKYKIICGDMAESLKEIPVADYMSFVNSHYYLLIQDWMRMLDNLHAKTRHVIITGTRKKEYFCMASAWGRSVKRYFEYNWDLLDKTRQLPREGDPNPRSLSSYLFKSKHLERIPVDKPTHGGHIQGMFHEALDKGQDPFETRYFKMMRRRKRKTPLEDLKKRMMEKVAMYDDVKKNGMLEALIVDKHYRIRDGNHRSQILKHLGEKELIVRVV